MTKTKTTKRALIASVLSLLVCVSMLIGSTFAWFTDTASTGVNKIVSGNLDIALEMYDETIEKWVDAEGKTLDFKKAADASAGEEVLWEPGCTYELPKLRVVNKGNLALKYQILITGINGNAELNEAIEWTITGVEDGALAPKADKEFTIKGHMKEEAGNEYQGLTIEGISITVLATQQTAEYDSYDNQYDKDASNISVWDGTTDADGLAANTDDVKKIIEIKTAGQLAAFAVAVNGGNTYEGYTVELMAPIDLASIDWAPIGATNGETMDSYPSYTFAGTFDGNGLTISNLNVTSNGANAVAGLFGTASRATIKNVVVDGANIKSEHYAGGILAYDTEYTNIIGCTVKNANIISSTNNTNDNGDKAGGIVGAMTGAHADYAVSGNKVIDSTIIAYRDCGGIIGYAADGLSVKENTVKNTKIVQDASDDYKSPDTPTTFGEIVGRGTPALKNNKVSDNTIMTKAGNANVVVGKVDASAVIKNDVKNAYVNLAGETMSQNTNTTINNGEYTVENGTVTNNGNEKYVDVRPGENQNVNATYNGVNFVSTYKNKTYGPCTNRFTNMVKVIPTNGEAEFNFVNCNFENAKIEINGLSGYTGKAKVTFTNCTFSGLGTGPIVDAKNYLDIEIVFENCTFDIEATGSFSVVSGMASSEISVTAKNCTLNGTAAVATTDEALNGTVDQIKINNPSVKFFGSNLDTVVSEGNTFAGIAVEK